MDIYEIKVTPEIAQLRHDDAGERRVMVVEPITRGSIPGLQAIPKAP